MADSWAARNLGQVHSTALFYPALPTPTGFAEVAFGSKDEARRVQNYLASNEISR